MFCDCLQLVQIYFSQRPGFRRTQVWTVMGACSLRAAPLHLTPEEEIAVLAARIAALRLEVQGEAGPPEQVAAAMVDPGDKETDGEHRPTVGDGTEPGDGVTLMQTAITGPDRQGPVQGAAGEPAAASASTQGPSHALGYEFGATLGLFEAPYYPHALMPSHSRVIDPNGPCRGCGCTLDGDHIEQRHAVGSSRAGERHISYFPMARCFWCREVLCRDCGIVNPPHDGRARAPPPIGPFSSISYVDGHWHCQECGDEYQPPPPGTASNNIYRRASSSYATMRCPTCHWHLCGVCGDQRHTRRAPRHECPIVGAQSPPPAEPRPELNQWK